MRHLRIVIITSALLVLVLGGVAVWRVGWTGGMAPAIDSHSGNYGLFINGLDSGYFSTTDPNVKRIVRAYLVKQDARTDADTYGSWLVYYYTKDVFITAELISSADRTSVSVFAMHDMQTGKVISNCNIFTEAGFYKDDDLLLSVSYTGEVPYVKQGVCLYERGAPNFTFIDLSPQLSSTETLFSDPTGRSLSASLSQVNTQAKTFDIAVYDTTKKDVEGAYAYKRSITVAY